MSMSAAELKAGVIAASAGKQAQGVAYYAQRLGVLAFIGIPEFPSYTKVEGVKRLDAEAILDGETLEEPGSGAGLIEQERGLQ